MNRDKQGLEFGKLLKRLSEKLMAILGKGFSKRSLEQYRKFYLNYNEITQALPAQSFQSLFQADILEEIVAKIRISTLPPFQRRTQKANGRSPERVGGTS